MIAYEMLTGGRPSDATNQATLITHALTTAPTRAAARRSGLPQAIDDAVMKALAKDVNGRWTSVVAFMDALQAAVGQSRAPAAASGDGGLSARYEFGALIGRGRLGSLVYQATHRALGVPVAIRVLKRDNHSHWDAVRARFLLEARTLQVSHPSLASPRFRRGRPRRAPGHRSNRRSQFSGRRWPKAARSRGSAFAL